MRTLETERLIIRAFVLADGDTYSRLLDAAFGADSYGSLEAKGVVFHYQVAADAGLALLHQPPYGDRAIALRNTGEIIGSVGFAPALAPFGCCRRSNPVRCSRLRWASSGRSFRTSSTRAMRPKLPRR